MGKIGEGSARQTRCEGARARPAQPESTVEQKLGDYPGRDFWGKSGLVRTLGRSEQIHMGRGLLWVLDWAARLDFAGKVVSGVIGLIFGAGAYFSDWGVIGALLATIGAFAFVAVIYLAFCHYWDGRQPPPDKEISISRIIKETEPRPDIDARAAFFRILEQSEWTQEEKRKTPDTSYLVDNWIEVRLDDEIHRALINGKLDSWGEEILSNAAVAPERPIPHEMWRQIEITFDRLNVPRTSAHWRTSGQEKGKMAWVGIKFSERQILGLFPLVTSAACDMPIHQAVAHVARVIEDTDTNGYFPRARLALRQAAFTGQIVICGKRSRNKMGAGLGMNEVATPIPREYWETAEISHMATDPAVDDQFHTFPHRFSDGVFGEEIFRYASLRTNRGEVMRQWPAN
jgi:hypothetical protein